MDRKYKKKAGGEVRSDEEDTDRGDDTPAAPEKLRASEVKSTAVTVAWTQPESPDCCPIVAYRIMSRNLNSQYLSQVCLVGRDIKI